MTVFSELPGWPAALRLDQAAAYCGFSPAKFKEICPVKPVAFTESTRGARYLRVRLDSWLASLDPDGQSSPERRFGEKINGGQGEARRA